MILLERGIDHIGCREEGGYSQVDMGQIELGERSGYLVFKEVRRWEEKGKYFGVTYYLKYFRLKLKGVIL